MEELKVLRKLAQEYYEQALSPVNMERMRLHRAVNDLKMERPIVLLDEIPWHEINFDHSLTVQCTDPDLREVERTLRKRLFQWKYFPGDMILPPYAEVRKIMKNSGIGISIQEERLDTASILFPINITTNWLRKRIWKRYICLKYPTTMPEP